MGGIKLTKNNVLTGTSPTILASASIGEVASHLTTYDHSLNYTSGNSSDDFIISLGSVSDISYVALSGMDATASGGATITLLNETLPLDSVTLKRNNNVMFTFDERSFGNLIVRISTLVPESRVTLSYIAAGQLIDVEEGEQSGYKCNWLTRSIVQQTTSNRQAAPVGSIQISKPLSGTLRLPNLDAQLSQNEYQDFIDYTYEQPFFIKEIEDKPESTYICFDPTHGVASHRSTRELNVATIKFKAFTGL